LYRPQFQQETHTKEEDMDVHEQVLESMKEMAVAFATQGITLHLPPPSGIALGTHYTALDMGKSLTAQFQYNHAFTNPIGTIQGGFISAAFDDVCGPLAYMAAKKPVITIEMSTSFMRPFSAADAPIKIKADIVSQSRSLLVVKAEARSQNGKLLATFTSHGLVAGERHLK
jgi:uncharacterized protein (TIGR00369 family)